jgi:anti-sigma factor RsiW
MSHVSDEVLMAYADGELTPDECYALERLLRHDPVLRARLEPFIQTRMRLATAFEPTLHEPVPLRLIAAIRRSRPPARASLTALPLEGRLRDVVSKAKALLAPGGSSLTPALAASIAALLVAGAMAGWIAGRATAPSSLMASSGPDLVATGALAEALEANPSGTSADGAEASVVPVLSFRTADNAVCREYRVKSTAADRDFAGLACRNADGVWRIALHVETGKLGPASPEASYQTATATNVPSIDAMVETMMAGEAFGTDDETRLLKNGWRDPR